MPSELRAHWHPEQDEPAAYLAWRGQPWPYAALTWDDSRLTTLSANPVILGSGG